MLERDPARRDALQVETALFGEAGAAAQLQRGSIVTVSSTVAPAPWLRSNLD
jgi:hypothetical protein